MQSAQNTKIDLFSPRALALEMSPSMFDVLCSGKTEAWLECACYQNNSRVARWHEGALSYEGLFICPSFDHSIANHASLILVFLLSLQIANIFLK